jgi:hypothetical protein
VQYTQLGGTVPTWNQSTTGTAANITATSNSTLTTLSALALPYTQLTGAPSLNYLPLSGGSTTGNSNFGGSGNLFFNNVASTENDVIVEGGASGSQANAAVEWATPTGTAEWKWKMDSSNYLRLTDVVNSLDREVIYQNGNTMLNAGAGANAVVVNNTSGSGTGGFIVYEGGANNTVAAFTVGGTGNLTALGTVTNSGLATSTAGTGTVGTSSNWYASAYFGNASHYVNLTPATQTGNYTLTIPVLSANDTVATLGVANVFTAKQKFAASTTSAASISIPPGSAPTTPASGDCWTTTTVGTLLQCYLGSTTYSFASLSGSQTFTSALTFTGWTSTANNTISNSPAVSQYALKMSGTVQAGGTSTTNFPLMGFIQGGTAVTSWSTGGTQLGFNGPSGFAGNYIDVHTNGGSSQFTVNASGGVLATGHGNESSLTVAAGTAAGTSPTIACATNVTCGWNGGTINLLTGTSPTTGALLTVTDAVTHAKYPSCVYQIVSANSSYVPNGTVVTTGFYPTNSSYTVETLNVSAALSASSYYVINYTCSGI